MDIKVRRFESNYLIDVGGDIDLYNAFQLKDLVQTMIEEEIGVVILNMNEVTYVDSSGIGVLLSISAVLRQKGIQFRVVHVPSAVMRVMELMRLIDFLPIEKTECDALSVSSTYVSRIASRKRSVWESVHHAIEHSKTLTVRTFTYLPGERLHIDRILAVFLKAVDMAPLGNNLSYCIHELAGNAKRANTKRLYFQEKQLDILDDRDYAAGMEGFKKETVERFDHYLARLRECGLYVKFQFRKTPAGLRICIRNNVILTPAEKRRIDDKLAIARSFSCLADAYGQTEDGSEGAGLGIVMMLFMLRNLGFDHDAFSIRTSRTETVATLTLMRPASVRALETESIASA